MTQSLWAIQGREGPSSEWIVCQTFDSDGKESACVYFDKEAADIEHLYWVENGNWEYRLVEVEIKLKEAK